MRDAGYDSLAGKFQRRGFEFCFLAKRFLGDFACDLNFLQLAGQKHGAELERRGLRLGQVQVFFERTDPAALIFTRQKLQFVISRTEDHTALVHERLFLQ